MDLDTVRSKMMAQVDQARQGPMAAVFGWAFETDDLVVFVTLRHRRQPERVYLLRVSFDDFPKRAPSYLFVDSGTKQMKPEAWPPDVGHGNPPTGICTPGTREFHEQLHRNDAQYVWDAEKYTFLTTLEMIHRMMERGIR